MNRNAYTVLAFLIGAGAGGFIVWKCTKTKYETILKNEANELRESFAQRRKELELAYEELTKEKKQIAEAARNKPAIPIASYNGYMEDSNRYINNTCPDDFVDHNKPMCDKEPVDYHYPVDKPHVISPEEYGEYDDYNRFSLYYYADGYLADDNDDLVDDVEEAIGWESLNHFGDFEYDSVKVRNDARKCDYEILMSMKNYYGDVKPAISKSHECLIDVED